MSLLDGSSPSHDTEELISRVIEIIDGTRTLPLSSSVKLDNKEEVLELLDEACQRLPDEMKQARWLLKERGEFLAKMQREGDDILQAARLQAERMVQRTEIVREARWIEGWSIRTRSGSTGPSQSSNAVRWCGRRSSR